MNKRFVLCLSIALICFGACIGNVLAEKPLAGDMSSVIVVRPRGWGDALAEWMQYRQARYHLIELDACDSPHELRQAILRQVSQAKNPVVAILLCGDVAVANEPNSTKVGQAILVPTFEIPTRVKLGPFTTPSLATDLFYGDVNDDECPDIAVGRLPAKSAADLSRMLKRSIDYEQSQSFGPWRDRIHATAGVGGFGVIADTAIETVTRRLLSEGIPDRFQLQMTHASLTSPFCPDPHRLTQSFIGKINEGGLFWVYMGHGNVHQLDHFAVGNEYVPICSAEHIPQFQVQDGPPIAVMLACFTGAFDARIDCFAEMLLAKNDGPIAVIAGSRVTMPYGLSQFSTELMDGCFQDRTETLGEIVLNAKRSIWNQTEAGNGGSDQANTKNRLRDNQKLLIANMATALSPAGHDLSEERKEHVRLMNLLGDPLLRIRQPAEISIQCEEQHQSGATIKLKGISPISGQMHVELVLSRDRLPDGIKTVPAFDGAPEQRQQMQQNYAQASNLVLLQSEQTVAPGDFAVDIPIPIDCRGRCVVRAIVYGADDWASGTQRIKVTRPSK